MAHFWRVGVAVGLINALSNNADEFANCCDCFSVANHSFIIIQMLIGNRIKLHFIHNFFHVLIEFLSFVSFSCFHWFLFPLFVYLLNCSPLPLHLSVVWPIFPFSSVFFSSLPPFLSLSYLSFVSTTFILILPLITTPPRHFYFTDHFAFSHYLSTFLIHIFITSFTYFGPHQPGYLD